MEPKFKTSFIPKKAMQIGTPTVPDHRPAERKGGVLKLIGIIIFVITLAATGAVFVYQNFLINSISTNAQRLQDARAAFQPALIKEIERYANRVTASEQILDSHLAPSAVFELFEAITFENVQYLSMEMTVDKGLITAMFEGQAANLDAIALQSDMLGENRFVNNALVHGVNVDQSQNRVFMVNSEIDKVFLLYSNRLEDEGVEEDDAPVGIQPQQQSQNQGSAAAASPTNSGTQQQNQQQPASSEEADDGGTTNNQPVVPPPPGGVPSL